MAVSPADFELYSRVTGRAIPRDRASRMKMAPEVNRFIRNKEYERPEKTTLQKGADILGKAALIGGTLAAAHAIGGGFSGKGEGIGKVAEAVGNMAKTGVTGGEGMASHPMEVYEALKQEQNIKNVAPEPVTRGPFVPKETVLPSQPTGSAQVVSKADEVDAWLAKNQWIKSDAGITGRNGNIGQEKQWLKEELDARKELATGLTSEQRQQSYKTTLGKDDEEAERRWWNLQLDAMARDRDPDGPPPPSDSISSGSPTPESPTPVSPTDIVSPSDPGVQRLAGGVQKANTSLLGRVGNTVLGTARGAANKLDQEPWGAQREKAIASNLAYGIAARGLGIGPQGGRIAGTGFNEGATQGILSRVGNLPIIRQGLTEPLQKMGDYSVFRGADVNLPNWLGGGFSVPGIPTGGQMLTGFLANNPDAAAFANAGGVTLAEGAGLGAGLLVGGAAKDAAKAALIAERAIRPVGRAIGQAHNKVLVPAGRAAAGFHGNYLVPQGRQFHQNVLVPAGREFHQNVLVPSGNAALDGIQRNMNALRTSADQQLNIAGKVGAASDYILPTTRSTGQVVSGANAQLNRHPDVLPGETDTAPSRVIHTVRDSFRLAGEGEAGSLTPDDVVIRTDIEEKDPVNVRTWAGERRPSAKTKAEFAAGLRDRNAEFYDLNELSKTRDRATTGFDWRTGKRSGRGGSSGEAATISGVAQYQSPDDRPENPVGAFWRGLTSPLEEGDQKLIADAQDKIDSAKSLGARIAKREKEADGVSFIKDDNDPWFT